MKNNIYFFFGPSGVGKSSTLKSLSRAMPDLKVVSLDSLVVERGLEDGFITSGNAFGLLQVLGGDCFFVYGLDCLYRYLESIDDKAVKVAIDVGAGFQNNRLMACMSRFYNTVCLSAEPQASFERFSRHRSDGRDFKLHCEIEFSPVRQAIYSSSSLYLDTSNLTEEEVVNELVGAMS